jgi:hypothetical protein
MGQMMPPLCCKGLFYLLLAVLYHINATFEDATVESNAIIGTHQTMTFRDSHGTKHILIVDSFFAAFQGDECVRRSEKVNIFEGRDISSILRN